MKEEISKISSDNLNILQSNENMSTDINQYENNIYNFESGNNRLKNEVKFLKGKYLANEEELK